MTAIRLGPFQLIEPLGRGGMARVWSGVHAERQVPVAIKVMTEEQAHKPRFRAAFGDEIRAVARLQHPGIIMVFDYGQVEAKVARASGGSLVEGSPYLAMELGKGTLADVNPQALGFNQQRTILLRLLDALAYAHARGVIHRDLKPANILVVSDGHGPSLKLADFGLAHAFDGAEDRSHLERKISGTPRFIAPEQITGDWRGQGPWTDLYALGCVACWLVSGKPPFYEGDTQKILRSHLRDPPPELEVDGAAARGFQAWLEKMMAKEPGRRFQRAADAAQALRALGSDLDLRVTVPVEMSRPGSDAEEITELLDQTLILPELEASGVEIVEEGEDGAISVVVEPPATWKAAKAQPRSDDVLAAGLSLFGLRQVPMVDREGERDLIWNSLLDVHRCRSPRVVVLRGPAGTGKSRLAQWCTERADEVGAATVMRAEHGAMLGPTDGLSQMVSNHLRCAGLGRKEILERVQKTFRQRGPLDSEDLFDCLAMTEIIATTTAAEEDAGTGRVHFAHPRDRYAVIARFIDDLARRRPVILWFDDIEWAGDSLQFVDFYLRRHGDGEAVLFLLSGRSEELLQQDCEGELLLALEGRSCTEVVEIEALPEEDHLAMVQGLLNLQDSLAADVARRTSGNPLFAVQLVSDWVERNLLLYSPGGYHLGPGEEAALPDELHHLLVHRLQLVVSHLPEEEARRAQKALELAAALGRSVDRREWEALCRLVGVAPPYDVVDAMMGAGLARRTAGGWSFVHDALREALHRLAEDEGRWRSHHRSCARMLSTLYGADRLGISLRISRHLWRARQWEQVTPYLLAASQEALLACDNQRAHQLLDHSQKALDRLGVPEDDRRRVASRIHRAKIYNHEGEFPAAREALLHDLEVCTSGGWEDLRNEALYSLGSVYRDLGEIKTAQDHLVEAREGYRRKGDWTGVAKTTHNLGALFQWLGQFDEAEASYHEGLSHFEKYGDLRGMALCYNGLATLMTRRHDFDGAIPHLEKALEYFEKAGDRIGISNTLNSLGEVARYRQDFAGAEEYYRSAVSTRRRLGTTNFFVPQFNLALTLIDQGDFETARRELKAMLGYLEGTGQKAFAGITHTGLTACAADAGDWKAWDHHLAQSRQILDESGFVHRDVATLLELAANLARAAGEERRGGEAAQCAAEHWRVLGRA